MADDRPASAVFSLREKFETLSTTPVPSTPRRLSPISSPDLRSRDNPLAEVYDAKAVALRRPPPPPPGARANHSRSPSPIPPVTVNGDSPPPLPSRSNQSLIAHASNTVVHHEIEQRHSSGSTGGSSSQDNQSTDSTSRTSEDATDASQSGFGDFTLTVPGLTAALGAGVRRGSMPSEALRYEAIDTGEVMVRSSTHADKRVKPPPPPPPRSRPMVPPRPVASTKPVLSLIKSALHPEYFHSDSLAQHHSSSSYLAPPPLPSRDKKGQSNSDEESSFSPIPQPPPRRTSIANFPPPARAVPAPQEHTPPSLRSAISLVKNALEISHQSKDRTKLATSVKPGSGIPSVALGTADISQVAPLSTSTLPPPRPPPPPTRHLALSDKLPLPRKSQPSPDEGSSSSDVDDAASIHSQKASTGPSKHRQRTLEDLPDSSDFNRKPPIVASLSTSPGFPAIPLHTQQSVYAVAGDVICIASTSVKIYDLGSISNATHPKPRYNIDIKDTGLEWRVKDPRITAIEFRPGNLRSGRKGKDKEDVNEGRYLWCGSRDGHLWEVDVFAGEVVRVRSAAHGAAITHIMRHGNYMVTLDETGKVLVFGEDLVNHTSMDSSGDSVMMGLLSSNPRISRISSEQGFAKIMYGKLWVSSGSGGGLGGSGGSGAGLDSGGTGSTTGPNSHVKGPTIRVYDIFASKTPLLSSGSSNSSLGDSSSSSSPTATLPPPPSLLHASSKSAVVLHTEAGVGAVTAGCTLATQSGLVYIGHEGGYLTVWDVHVKALSSDTVYTALENKEPVCVQTLKISTSDILCLEGVYSRLWSGSRNGSITVYNVEDRPWVVTNVWKHGGYGGHGHHAENGQLPVTKLLMDVHGIAKVGRLIVASVGRDDLMRFWDGLLGTDWIEGEVRKREALYSTFRHINMMVCTWNVDAAKPEALTPSGLGSDQKSKTNEANINFLEDVLKSVDRPDVLVFGFQELIDLESRKLTAKTVLLGSQKQKRNADGSISDKVSRAYRLWYDRLVLAVRVAMPPDNPYTVIHSENLVGLFTCIFVRNAEKAFLRDIAITTVKRGMGGRYGNKGAIVARFVIDDSSFCFINCHLAAGQHHKHSRNQDVAAILEEKSVFPDGNAGDSLVAYAGGGDGSMVLDHEVVFLNGDLNYRIDQRREAVISNIKAGQIQYLLTHDQLLKEMKVNPGFRLRSFLEAPIAFPPTYKYDRKTDDYDTSAKRRVPAWCDRILYRCRDTSKGVEVLHYRRYEVNVSDHRPVSGGFRVRVKSVEPAKRAAVKVQVEEEWKAIVRELLAEAKEFCASQGMS